MSTFDRAPLRSALDRSIAAGWRRVTGQNQRSDAAPPAGGRLGLGLRVGLALALIPLAACSRVSAAASEDLDISRYQQTWEETFPDLSIAADPGTDKRWFAHTPWNGDFGDAPFANPGPGGPFSLDPEGGLDITASKDPEGKWSSGLISSHSQDGPKAKGFAQAFGYFEMKAELPGGDGVWPAFWLMGVDKSKSSSEIDVMEFYGRFPKSYHVTCHIWKDGKDTFSKWKIIDVDPGILSRQFNTFGVSIEDKTTTFYFNRKAVFSIDTPPEYKQPFYILANLATGSGWPTDKLTSPQVMRIKYIKAFRLKTGAPPVVD